MAPYTTFRIGGKAQYWYEPKNKKELMQFLRCSSPAFPLFIIGAGSNLLIREGVLKKIFIYLGAPAFRKFHVSGTKVTVGAGLRLNHLISNLSSKNLSGYEFLAGIPGTVGGALAMNAGAKRDAGKNSSYREIGDIVSWVEVLDREGNCERLSKKNIRFLYRNSSLKSVLILKAQFVLVKSDKRLVQNRIQRLMEERMLKQDGRYPSAGSFFKNPKRNLAAGRLIDLCHLKGFAVGGAMVSDKHANFILNVDQARSSEVVRLMEIIQKKVYNLFKIKLIPEVQIVS